MTDTVDVDATAAFAARAEEIVNDAMLALMLSVGFRTRLLDVMAGLDPSTSEEVAAAAGLHERYVREWLGAMVTGGIVEYDPVARSYHLPGERAASLTRAAGPRNMAAWATFVGFLAPVEDQIVDCFRNGGGVPYSAFPKFVKAMSRQSRVLFDNALVSAILPLVPGLVGLLREGIDVADVGCGAGRAVNVMAREFPASRFVGYDFLDEAVAVARAEAAGMGLSNARFEVKDAATLDGGERFDLVTSFTAVHDQARPRDMLRGIAVSLKPGGVYLCMDSGLSSEVEDNVGRRFASFAYTLSTMHCMTVSLAEGGEGLGDAWAGPQALRLFAEAGFATVEKHNPEWHEGFDYYACRVD